MDQIDLFGALTEIQTQSKSDRYWEAMLAEDWETVEREMEQERSSSGE